MSGPNPEQYPGAVPEHGKIPDASRQPRAHTLPPWAVLHLPHDSTEIPAAYRGQFLLSDVELQAELIAMTDAHTAAMFAPLLPPANTVRFPVSRLLVDVERFEDDAQEIMVSRGMGVIYSHTSRRELLRRVLTGAEREGLLASYYRPHHVRFEQMVRVSLNSFGSALVLDAHSFPSRPRPYELDQTSERPDICIGSDPFHTPRCLVESVQSAFLAAGLSVQENSPFAGAIVPQSFYRRDPRVSSIMIEVNRSLYMDEDSGLARDTFGKVAQIVRHACLVGVAGAAVVIASARHASHGLDSLSS